MKNRLQASLAAGLTAAALLASTGCTTVGSASLENETQSSVQDTITRGVTTRAQVVSRLGVPLETSYTDSGLEIIRYEYSRFTPTVTTFIPYVNLFSSGAKEEKKELVILLDENRVVKQFAMNESKQRIREGILE